MQPSSVSSAIASTSTPTVNPTPTVNHTNTLSPSHRAETQNQINTLVNTLSIDGTKLNTRIVSKNNNDYLVELDDHTHIIVNTVSNTVHSTKMRDSGINFEGTGYQKYSLLTTISLTKQTYENNTRLIRIMEILNLPTLIGWSEIDKVGNLSLVHYTADVPSPELAHLRGTLVDVDKGIVVASSYGYTPTVKLNQLQLQGHTLNMQDENNNAHTIPAEELVIKRVYEGTVMRVIFYDSQVYRLTHKKIRPLKSRWGTSPFFTKMYQEAGGPTDEQIFNTNKPYSPWCYVFLIVHPKLLMATRQNITHPYVVLLDIRHMYSSDIDSAPFDINDIESQQVHTFETSNDIMLSNTPHVKIPDPLSIYEANMHLHTGYYQPLPVRDPRQSTGEALIIYKIKDGQVMDIIKVNSIGYDYRFKLRGADDSNMYHRFFSLVDMANRDIAQYPEYCDLKQKIVTIQPIDHTQLKVMFQQYGNILYLPEYDIPLECRRDKYYILNQIWLNYIIALPLSLQYSAIDFLQQFIQERANVVKWLQNYHHNNIQLNEKDISKSGIRIISEGRKTGKDLFKAKKYKTVDEATLIVIRNFVYKEYGTSLYSLIKKMNNNEY